jgi:clan AA aspartic protease
MMRGQVNEHLEAIIQIEIYSENSLVPISAIIDTGCTEYLTLPSTIAASIGLNARQTMQVSLADGRKTMLAMGRAVVRWNGNDQSITVLVAETAPLIGMALLENFDLHVEVFDSGKVTIVPRS